MEGKIGEEIEGSEVNRTILSLNRKWLEGGETSFPVVRLWPSMHALFCSFFLFLGNKYEAIQSMDVT